MNVLIIEDEEKTALDLQSSLEEEDKSLTVVKIIDTVDGTVHWLKNNPMPDLIFMDIQLADGLSFEIFDEADIRCPVVFCTAYNEYAIDAFKVNGVDYILKPFDSTAIARSLGKVNRLQNFFQRSDEKTIDQLISSLHVQSYRASFLVNYKERLIPISVQDIACFAIEHEVTFIYTFAKERYSVQHTLDELEALLDPNIFYRANRQYIINRNSITAVEHLFARKLSVVMNIKLNDEVVVSKAKATQFLRWMENR